MTLLVSMRLGSMAQCAPIKAAMPRAPKLQAPQPQVPLAVMDQEPLVLTGALAGAPVEIVEMVGVVAVAAEVAGSFAPT